MIELKPKIENPFVCPECQSETPSINDVLIQSIHTMADCTCKNCGFRFYQVFPVGHHVEDLLAMGKEKQNLYPAFDTEEWLLDTLRRAQGVVRQQEVTIRRVVYKEVLDVVILNTLDYLYGHVLLKLYNSFYHLDRQPNLGLVLIVPKMFEWMIPAGCAEAWIVDLKLSELAYHHESIQRYVSQQFSRFNIIYLSKAYSHPDVSDIDISRLTGVKPFDPDSFSRKKPVITFVLREDRWWFASVLDYWFYRVCRKLKILSWGKRIISRRQNALVRRAIHGIKERIPEASFFIVGLGDEGRFGDYAIDERVTKINDDVERGWCNIYAMSHVVVGIHGSNMLLPTALAAGCVEILPEERFGNMVQDISVRYHDRRQLFFYRFADQYCSSRNVAAKVVAMIKHYDKYHRNMCRNFYH